MALTLQECIDKIKKEYPHHYPYVYVEFEGKYIFNLIAKGADPEGAISDMHVVDPETGYISGGISIMEFVKDAKFREVWKHANLVANHDDSLQHSSFPKSSSERGWRVRKNQNGSKSGPFVSKASDYGDNLTYGGSLMHHGIKGQSWGVRNGPPYPLDQKTHNKVVKEAGKSPSGRSDGSNDGKTGLIPETIALVSILAINAYMNSPKVVEKRQQKEQIKFNKQNRSVSEDILGDIADVRKDFSSDNMPKQISGNHSSEDDMAAVNPRYKNGVVPGTSVNCVLCSCTYDLRRRGYDVTALSSETGNYTEQILKGLYKDPVIEHVPSKSFTEMFDNAAKKYPEGARGEISVSGLFMGHSMAWEIKNGKFEVLDTQRNVRVTPSDLLEFGFMPGAKNNTITRTDNLEIKPEGINLVAAEYKPGAKKILKAEQAALKAKNDDKKKGIMTISEAKRRKKYEEAYLKEHPNADRNSEGLKNYVESQMNAK